MDMISSRNCRICLSQCETRDLDISEFSQKYVNCTGFDIKPNDIPKKICSTCTSELINASNFLSKCEETEVILANLQLEMLDESEQLLNFEEVMSQVKKEMDGTRIIQEVATTMIEQKTVENVEMDESVTIKMEDEEEEVEILHEMMKTETTTTDTEVYELPPRLKCDYCEYEIQSYQKMTELRNHVKKCHEDVIVMKNCPKCVMNFPLEALLEYHIHEQHEKFSMKDHLTCTFCGIHSHRVDIIHRHVTSYHKNEQLFECIICRKTFRTKDSLRLHIKRSFCGTNILSDDDIDVKFVLSCDFCDFTCALEANMRYHVEKMHANEDLSHCSCGSETITCHDLVEDFHLYKCNASRSCSNLRNLIGGPQRKHTDGLTAAQRKKIRQREIVTCEYCDEKIKRASLNRHINNLHKGVKYICEHCQKSYTLLQNLKHHIIKHHMGQKFEFPCQYCDKKFNTWSTRHYHQIRNHTKNFPYNCKICRKQFLQLAQLEDHNFIHTGVKTRKCDECEEIFATREMLKGHKETVHRTDPPLECKMCERTFLRSKQLRKHVREIHGKQALHTLQEEESNQMIIDEQELQDVERLLGDCLY